MQVCRSCRPNEAKFFLNPFWGLPALVSVASLQKARLASAAPQARSVGQCWCPRGAAGAAWRWRCVVVAGRHLASETRPLITPRRRGGVGGWQRRGGRSWIPAVTGSPHRAPRLSSAVPPGLLRRPGSSPGAPSPGLQGWGHPRGRRRGARRRPPTGNPGSHARVPPRPQLQGSQSTPRRSSIRTPVPRPRRPALPPLPVPRLLPTGPPRAVQPSALPAPPPPSSPPGHQSRAPPHWPAESTDLPTPGPPGLADPQESLRGLRQVASDSTGTHHSHRLHGLRWDRRPLRSGGRRIRALAVPAPAPACR
ncbi:hypothetical protein H8959_006778 [Pygathrix nigripes]